MTNITFIDLEVNPVNRQILDMGAIRNDGVPFHANSPAQFIQFITQTEYIGCLLYTSPSPRDCS